MKEYNKHDIKEGMQLQCTDNGGWEHWTTGKVYTVFKDTMGLLVMQSDTGGQRDSNDIAQYLNGVARAKFELLNEEDNKNMYTVGDLVKINDDLRAGCEYKIYCNDEMETYRGKKAVIVGFDTLRTQWDNDRKIYKLQKMNGENIEWSFTDDMFKLTTNTTEPPFKVGDKVRVLNNGTLASKADGNFYRTGDIDVVGYVECYKNSKGGRIRLGTHGSANWIHFDMIELVEEEPETTETKKYARITKIIKGTPDIYNLKVGEVYEVTEFLHDGVRVKLDSKATMYFLRSDQYELTAKPELGYFKCTTDSMFWSKGKIYPVSYDENAKLYTIADDDGDERAEPTLELLIQYATHKIKATMIYMNDSKEDKEENKDINKVSDLLQAKIDELTTQAEHLFKKRDRLDEHAKNLNAKARRLEEVRDELNKFK